MGAGLIRIQFQGALKLSLRASPIPVREVRTSEHSVRLGKGIVHGQSLFGVGSRLRYRFAIGDGCVVRERSVIFRQTYIGQGVAGVLVDGVLEIIARFVQ